MTFLLHFGVFVKVFLFVFVGVLELYFCIFVFAKAFTFPFPLNHQDNTCVRIFERVLSLISIYMIRVLAQ